MDSSAAAESTVTAGEALFASARKVMPGGRNAVLRKPHPFYVVRGEGLQQ